ncbi:isoaspartyl peptidase/L-asparaginase [Calliopsis andreniformis]|uniref:isoaspartyl peptidase/L-asparaginase n=1 Tax=Calliopsis andreniformis TaxID=337506 RepID=UPI003FCDC6CA
MCDYCSWIDQILARIKVETTEPLKKKPRVHVDPVVVVHGGAGRIPQKEREQMLLEVKNAAIEAYRDLINGKRAVDAVEKAISHMESKPYFNCARGGALDVNDEVVMDAGIVTKDNAGFVGGVRDIEHPITLARKVLEKTEHVLIVENGAQKFALDNGIEILPPGSLNVYESTISQRSDEESMFECVSSCSGEGEWNEDEWKNNIEDGRKKECRSDCVVVRSEEGEAFPYCVMSISDLDEPTVLQVSFITFYAYLNEISTKP